MWQAIVKALNFTQPAVIQQDPTRNSWLQFKDRHDENTLYFRATLVALPALFNTASFLNSFSNSRLSSPTIDTVLLAKLSVVVPSLFFKIETYRSNLAAAHDIAVQFKKGVTDRMMSEIANDPEAVQALINACPDEVLTKQSTDGLQRTLLQTIINSTSNGSNKEESLSKVISLYAKQGLKFTIDDVLLLAKSKKFSELAWSSPSRNGLFDTGVVDFKNWTPRELALFDESYFKDDLRTEVLQESKERTEKQNAKANGFYNKHRFKIIGGVLGVAATAFIGLGLFYTRATINKASMIASIKNAPATVSSCALLAAVAADTARRAWRS